MEQQKLFRRTALEKLQSPEQLDELMTVARPGTWIALVLLGVLLALAIAWSVFGTLPTKVQAQGILIRTGGVFNISSIGGGPVLEVLVQEGDIVTQNQIIGKVDVSAMAHDLNSLREQLKELQEQHRNLTDFSAQDSKLQADSQILRRQQLDASIAFAQEQVQSLTEQLASDEALLERGLMTRSAVSQTRTSIFNARDQAERARSELKQLDVTNLSNRAAREREISRSQIAMSDTQRQLDVLEARLTQGSVIRSPYAGRIIEVKVRPGDVVAAGGALASLQQVGERGILNALIYVHSSDGKKVATGMEAQISPLSAAREEYGFMTAKVTYVSLFPSTPEAMTRVLGNPRLAETLAPDGSPFAVYAELERLPPPDSRIVWSSPKGESLTINAGTLFTASITIANRRPIDIVIPLLRHYTGI